MNKNNAGNGNKHKYIKCNKWWEHDNIYIQ